MQTVCICSANEQYASAEQWLLPLASVPQGFPAPGGAAQMRSAMPQ